MGSTNYGTQTITLDYNAEAASGLINERFTNIRPTGIYKGGYLSKVSDVLVTVSTVVCEIGNGTYQVRVSTAASQNITVATTTPYVVFRWTYTGATANYMDMLAVAAGSIQANDLIVGKCVFASSTLTGFSYNTTDYRRSTPYTLDQQLRVEPTETASMTVRIRGGRFSFGSQPIFVSDQVTSIINAPASYTRYDLVCIDTAGAIQVVTGTEGAGTPPNYEGRVPLAYLKLEVSTTSITASEIKDIRTHLTPALTTDTDGTLAANSDYKLATQKAVKTYVAAQLSGTIQAMFPVGCIYTSIVGTNPATLFGFGTWTAFGAGRVLAGLTGSGNYNTPEQTGGEETHTLTSSEMPSHTHTQNSHNHVQDAHSHSVGIRWNNGGGAYIAATNNNSVGYSATETAIATNQATTATNQDTGGGGAHNNLQPYIVVYFFKRTA